MLISLVHDFIILIMILTSVFTHAAGATCRIVELNEKKMGGPFSNQQNENKDLPDTLCHPVGHSNHFHCTPLEKIQERFTEVFSLLVPSF